jgi:hypothetical protein
VRFQYKYLRPLVRYDMFQILVAWGIGGFGLSTVLAYLCTLHGIRWVCVISGYFIYCGQHDACIGLNGPALTLQQSMATSLADVGMPYTLRRFGGV